MGAEGGPLRNAAHEVFAEAVASGKSGSEAYREAYPRARRWSGEAVRVKACRLRARADVSARIEGLQRACVSARIIERTEFLEGLTETWRRLVAEGDVDGMAKIGNLMAKCQPGLSEPSRLEVRNGGVTEDFRAPPAVERMSDDELMGMLREGAE